jgi:hypothetical protein
MKTSWKVLGFAPIVFCLLLLFAAAPSIAQCGPGGAGCQGCAGTCTGVACAVPYHSPPYPGACTPAQQAAGGYEISTVSNCAGSLAGVCKCYLPSFYQITQQNCTRVYYYSSSLPWEEPTAIASSATCATSEEPMAPATFPTFAEAPDENETPDANKAGAL